MSKKVYNMCLPTIAMASLAIVMSANVALAHHPLGGETPTTFWHGFLSGIGHPMIGFDHLAFILAAGIASAFVANRVVMPAIFITATIVGCLLKTDLGVTLPFAEFVIAASVIAIGAIAMSGNPVNAIVVGVLFTIAGLFHGGAYAEAIVGAETSPLSAYLLGFGLIQGVIMITAMVATQMLSNGSKAIALQPRFTGAIVAGIGATFLVENVETVLLAGI